MTTPPTFSRAAARSLLLAAAAAIIAGCDTHFGVTGVLPNGTSFTVPTGTFHLRMVDDEPLPHVTTGFGTVYSVVSGSLDLLADSTWAYHSVTVVSSPDGTVLGTSPANYAGKWIVLDSTIELVSPSSGSITIRKDTLYWRGGPKFSWEDTLRFALTR